MFNMNRIRNLMTFLIHDDSIKSCILLKLLSNFLKLRYYENYFVIFTNFVLH